MNPIDIHIPFPGCTVKGILYDHYTTEDLDQDILQVALPNGLTVDVGWYPDGDPNGTFKVVVYRDYWRNQLCPPIITRDPHEVAKAVAKRVAEYVSEKAPDWIPVQQPNQIKG